MDDSTLNSLVKQIYLDKRVRELLSKLQPEDLREDLLHHFIERLYSYNKKHPGKLFMLASKDKSYCHIVGANEPVRQELLAWVICGIKMELMSPRSPFSRKYRKHFYELPHWTSTISDNQSETPQIADIYSRLVQKGGKGFAAAVMAEIEKQEEERINGKTMKQQGVLQINLFV